MPTTMAPTVTRPLPHPIPPQDMMLRDGQKHGAISRQDVSVLLLV